MANDVEKWLKSETGYGSVYWLDYVGQRIKKHSKPVKGSVHDTTDPEKWLKDLVHYFWGIMKTKDWQVRDENLACAATLSMILCLWFSRCARAKSYDKRRPIKLRKKAQERLITYWKAMLECFVDESRDPLMFPSQEWESPYDPNATNGTYV